MDWEIRRELEASSMRLIEENGLSAIKIDAFTVVSYFLHEFQMKGCEQHILLATTDWNRSEMNSGKLYIWVKWPPNLAACAAALCALPYPR
jgi:hypothetical protein